MDKIAAVLQKERLLTYPAGQEVDGVKLTMKKTNLKVSLCCTVLTCIQAMI